MIYSLSHIDHYGPVGGMSTQADVDAGDVIVVAPSNAISTVSSMPAALRLSHSEVTPGLKLPKCRSYPSLCRLYGQAVAITVPSNHEMKATGAKHPGWFDGSPIHVFTHVCQCLEDSQSRDQAGPISQFSGVAMDVLGREMHPSVSVS